MATRQTGTGMGGDVEFKSVKLYYFDIKGRAEAIRLALHIGGIQFEDIRLDQNQFTQMKSQLPFGQVPVLEVDGKRMSQTMAILGWAGHYAKMNPGSSDVWREGKVWEIMNALQDCMGCLATSMKETDTNKRKIMREEMCKTELPQCFTNLDRLLENNKKEMNSNGEWCCGNNMTTADLMLFCLHDWLSSGVLDHIPTDIMNKYTNVNRVVTNVKNNQKVKEWYSDPKHQTGGTHGMQQQKMSHVQQQQQGGVQRVGGHGGQ